MSEELFDREKVKVVYTPRFNFARDASIGDYDKKKKRDVEAQKLISKLEQPAQWSFKGVLKAGKLERIQQITYPQINNGHTEKEGWGWQLDVSAVGSGSVDRLVLACKPNNIQITQKESKETVRVGRDDYKKIEATLTLAGTFRAIENVKKR
jgi:hypothetical protein